MYRLLTFIIRCRKYEKLLMVTVVQYPIDHQNQLTDVHFSSAVNEIPV